MEKENRICTTWENTPGAWIVGGGITWIIGSERGQKRKDHDQGGKMGYKSSSQVQSSYL